MKGYGMTACGAKRPFIVNKRPRVPPPPVDRSIA
jgi:hypothetical protein